MTIEIAPQKFIHLEFRSIEVLEFSITKPEGDQESTVQDYLISMGNELDEATGMLKVEGEMRLRNKSQTHLARYKALCIFELAGLDSLNWKAPESKAFRLQLSVIWNGIAISTIRGMMAADFKGTFLHPAVLPIIDPADYALDLEEGDAE
jgi:hypothetical protein